MKQTSVTRTSGVRRLLPLGAVLVAAVALCAWIGIARAADPRLDEADLALQKAVALLEASQTGGVDPKTQRLFDKAVARAIADVEDARANITDAKNAVDNP
jgi:hypothetical protein